MRTKAMRYRGETVRIQGEAGITGKWVYVRFKDDKGGVEMFRMPNSHPLLISTPFFPCTITIQPRKPKHRRKP